MQRKRSFAIIVSVVVALLIAVFVSGSLSAPEDKGTQSGFEDGQPIVVTGEIVCLPHRDQNGPMTLECAYGIKDEDGNYFGLSDTTPEHSLLSGLATNTSVQIEGIYSAQTNEKYQQLGTIEVKAVVE